MMSILLKKYAGRLSNKKQEVADCDLSKAPPVDLLSNHFYEDLEKLSELKPYLDVMHLHTDMKSNFRSVDGNIPLGARTTLGYVSKVHWKTK